MTAYSGTVAAISREEWAALSPSPTSAPDATDPVEEPHVHSSNVLEGLRPQVLALLEKHRALWSGHLGSIKATERLIELKPGYKPVRLNPHRMGPRTRELIKAQVDRMLKLEVIEPSQSEWASPVVLTPKPDGSPRFCIDYRQLNERTVRDTYPLPRMDDFLDSLGDAQVFSTLDCNARYWHIPLDEEDKPKTALTCHCGTYQCTRLPIGLCNAPATFKLAIDMILSKVKWQNVLVSMDDLIIFSADAESHLSHLDTVLTLLSKHGVTLKAQKCHLFTNEVEYLGHVVRPGRLSVDEKNLKAIKKASFPQTQTQLSSVFGRCNVYRRFTVDFAKTAKPLKDLNSVKLRAAAEAAALDLVAPAGVAGADAPAPPARRVAAVEPLALGAPVLPDAPLARGVPATGLPDLAVADAGVPLDAGAARPALEEAISSVGATPVDREEAIAAAP